MDALRRVVEFVTPSSTNPLKDLDPQYLQWAKAINGGQINRLEHAKVPTPTAEQELLWCKDGLEIGRKFFETMPDRIGTGIFFARPAGAEVLPLIVYFHGGCLMHGSAFDIPNMHWMRQVARTGVAVASIDFRNSLMPAWPGAPVAKFPAALNDCYTGLLWCHERAKELRIDTSRVCIAGDCGGGNLAIAVALKCKMENRLDLIPSGFFAMSPLINGIWPKDEKERADYPLLGTSDIEYDGTMMYMARDKTWAKIYGELYFDQKEPLAWPGFATEHHLQGLPRCVISVNECDPVRDEGINFYRRLLRAGVQARCVQLMGTPHSIEMGALFINPAVSSETSRALADFAFGDNTRDRRPLIPGKSNSNATSMLARLVSRICGKDS